MRREIYPAIDPKNPELCAAGKTVLITGGTGGIGGVGIESQGISYLANYVTGGCTRLGARRRQRHRARRTQRGATG